MMGDGMSEHCAPTGCKSDSDCAQELACLDGGKCQDPCEVLRPCGRRAQCNVRYENSRSFVLIIPYIESSPPQVFLI